VANWVEEAIQCYLDYRRAGGENQNPTAQLCALVGAGIQQGDTAEELTLLLEQLGA
jgi:hypothetical protein